MTGTESQLEPIRAKLQLETPSAAWGEAISGRLILRGCTRWPIAWTVEIILATPSGTPIGGERHSWNQVVVKSGQTSVHVFRFAIPPGTPPDPLVVRATVASEHLVSVQTPVTVLLPMRFRRLAETLEQVSGLRVAEWHAASYEGGIGVIFVPEAGAGDLFDGLRLEMVAVGGGVAGHLEIDPQEHSLADVLKAAIGLDRQRIAFRFSRNNPDVARRFFEKCLRPYLDAVRQLPIPAEKPRPVERTLPRAASAPTDDNSETR